MSELVERIEQRLRDIPVNNPGYITVAQETLANVLSASLIKRIAKIAAEEAQGALMARER